MHGIRIYKRVKRMEPCTENCSRLDILCYDCGIRFHPMRIYGASAVTKEIFQQYCILADEYIKYSEEKNERVFCCFSFALGCYAIL